MARYRRKYRRNHVYVKYGSSITLGSFFAVCLSWDANHSIFWAIFHFFCSWWYVLYWLMFK